MDLRLALTNYVDPAHWRWELQDADGNFLADHEVRLDTSTREYRGFQDVADYLDYHQPIASREQQLVELGKWIGQHVFDGVREELWNRRAAPALVVHVIVPAAAQKLLLRPFELACFADGTTFCAAGTRFVYQLEAPPVAPPTKVPIGKSLRILAVFSLPDRSSPLNLRRERYQLQLLVQRLQQTQNVSIHLRVLQYGATRDTLREALEQGEGWDIVHLSGHGERGALLLEDEQGGTDNIDSQQLDQLLQPARARLKLLILDACFSGAASHVAARRDLGLDEGPVAEDVAEEERQAETTRTELPSLAQDLSTELHCAVLAMRYPVDDTFATELMLALYAKLLDRHQPLAGALQLALGEVLSSDIPRFALAIATPVLVGVSSADLKLVPPSGPPERGPMELPGTGIEIGFPSEPERFVGRLLPMVRASQALAPRSATRGVFFHGMPGAGKTACALELAYRHTEGRFRGFVWYRGPDPETDIKSELFNLMFEIQRQLQAPDLGLTASLEEKNTEHFRKYTLPRMRALLQKTSLLLVLDNLENLLSSSNQWRDPLWGDLMAVLLNHTGPSRIVLTSRRVPADLQDHDKLQRESIHALSFAESVVLARELPNLRQLFSGEDALLMKTLRVVQGHPKLLELADGLAADRTALATQVAAAEAQLADQGEVLDAFFATGVEREGETRQTEEDYVASLHEWTGGVIHRLSATAQLLFTFLCRLELADRTQRVVAANWKDFLQRLGEGHAAAAGALAEQNQGLTAALLALEGASLLEVERPPTLSPEELAAMLNRVNANIEDAAEQWDLVRLESAIAGYTGYAIHPGVAETIVSSSPAAELAATDIELGDFHYAGAEHGEENQLEGGGGQVVAGSRLAIPYLLRQERWEDAATLLEKLLNLDESPETLAFAIPILRQIADATVGTTEGLENLGILGKTLSAAGQFREAESLLRRVLRESTKQGGVFRLASNTATALVNVFRATGRLAEALKMNERAADYTRQADLGPWTQLGVEAQRLQILSDLGRDEEVLSKVNEQLPQLETLPLDGEAEDSVEPWNVRELLLETGANAARNLMHWQDAFDLNAKSLQAMEARDATQLELALTASNDYSALLHSGRHEDARNLLLRCREVFEDARHVTGLGLVYSALADLEDETGGTDNAVRFEQIALEYSYRSLNPENCSVSHDHLALYLEKLQSESALVLAHQLADGVICLQTLSGGLSETVRSLANRELPASPPAFANVVELVEGIEGVRFRELFESLPKNEPDGDAAIGKLWQLVAERRSNLDKQQQVLESMPPTIQAAFELDDDDFSTALQAALDDFPDDQADAIRQQLREVGLVADAPLSDSQFLEFLAASVAAVASGDDSSRELLEAQLLPALEEDGWRVTEPIHRIWNGERNGDRLTSGLDEEDTALLQYILQLIDDPLLAERRSQMEKQQQVLEYMPPTIQAAFELDGDESNTALRAALEELPKDEADSIQRQLREAGLVGDAPLDDSQYLELFAKSVATVALGDDSSREAIEAGLPDLEEDGWQLTEPIHRIWNGEREADELTDGLDEQDTALLKYILQLIDELTDQDQ